jgi:hypothetical protein
MKKVFFFVFLLTGISFLASAQSANHPKTTKAARPAQAGKAPKTAGNSKNGKADTIQLNNRENYNWSDGQKATPTGKQATSSNGSGYATLKKDTSQLARKGKKKQ